MVHDSWMLVVVVVVDGRRIERERDSFGLLLLRYVEGFFDEAVLRIDIESWQLYLSKILAGHW